MFFKYTILSIRQIRQYKADFFIGAVPHLLSQLLNIAFFRIVLTIVTEINGWGYYELLFIYGQSLIVFGLYYLFFGNLRNMKALLFNGEFEIMRLRPISPIYHVMISSFQTDSLEQIVMGVIVLIYSVGKLKIEITIVKVLGLAFISVCGVVLLGGLAIVSTAILLFTKGTFSPLSAILSLKEFTKYPLSLFDEVVIFIFTWIVPIGIISYYPSLFFLRGYSCFIYCGIIAGGFFLVSLLVFRAALKRFEGMSS